MLIAVLAASVALSTATPSPSPSPASALAAVPPVAALTDKELIAVISSIWRLGMRDLLDAAGAERLVTKPQRLMPPDDPLVHYAVRGAGGQPEIWMSAEARARTDEPSMRAFNDAMTSAYLALAMERGAAGVTWQRAYAAAPDKTAFTRAFAVEFSSRMARRYAKARQDIAWVHEHVTPGMPRDEVYELLKSRGLTAANGLYNPGRSTGPGSCEYISTAHLAEWPRAGQPLPQTPCAHASASNVLAHPEASIEYAVDGSLACGTAVTQTFTFGDDDKLVSVVDSKESTTCV